MVRKNFAEGIDAVLGGGRSTIKPKIEKIISKDKSTPEVKTSINMGADLLEKFRALVFWERSTLKIEMERAVELYITSKGSKMLEQALEQFRKQKPNGKIKG